MRPTEYWCVCHTAASSTFLFIFLDEIVCAPSIGAFVSLVLNTLPHHLICLLFRVSGLRRWHLYAYCHVQTLKQLADDFILFMFLNPCCVG